MRSFPFALHENRAILRRVSVVKAEYGGGYHVDIAAVNDLENLRIKVKEVSKELLGLVDDDEKITQAIMTKHFVLITFENLTVKPYSNNGRQAFSYSADKAFIVPEVSAK